jgi:hypothetical protein
MPDVKLSTKLAAVGNNVVARLTRFRGFHVCEVNSRMASFLSTSAASYGSFARHLRGFSRADQHGERETVFADPSSGVVAGFQKGEKFYEVGFCVC